MTSVRLALLRGEQAGGIDFGGDGAARRVDAHDGVRLPDVGPQRPVGPLQFVEEALRLTGLGHRQPAAEREAARIANLEGRAAVAHPQALAIECQSPALAVVARLPVAQQCRRVVEQRALLFPGQLHEPRRNERESFAEEIVGEVHAARHPPGLELDAAELRAAVLPQALPETAGVPDQALGEGARVVRPLGEHPRHQLLHRRRGARPARRLGRRGGAVPRAAHTRRPQQGPSRRDGGQGTASAARTHSGGVQAIGPVFASRPSGSRKLARISIAGVGPLKRR